MAEVLDCEPSTIKCHMKRIYEKLRLTFPNLRLENTRHLLLYWRGEWHLLQK
jgi:DNA-binding NarL/FixJ family response regulator